MKTFDEFIKDSNLIQRSEDLEDLLIHTADRLRWCQDEDRWKEVIYLIEESRQKTLAFLVLIGKEWDR